MQSEVDVQIAGVLDGKKNRRLERLAMAKHQKPEVFPRPAGHLNAQALKFFQQQIETRAGSTQAKANRIKDNSERSIATQGSAARAQSLPVAATDGLDWLAPGAGLADLIAGCIFNQISLRYNCKQGNSGVASRSSI